MLIPLLEGSGEVLFGGGMDGPLTQGLEGLLGQDLARQLPLDGQEQKEACWS